MMNFKQNLLALALLLVATPAYAQWNVEVVWTSGPVSADGSDAPTGYKVERKTGVSGPWVEVGKTAATSFKESAPNPAPGGVVYCYRIRAFNSVGDGPYSGEGCGTSPAVIVPKAPTAPTNPKVQPVSSTQLRLSWTDRSDNETGFLAQIVGIAPIREEDIANANEELAIIGGLKPGAFYALRVAAINDVGRSSWTRGVYVQMPRQ